MDKPIICAFGTFCERAIDAGNNASRGVAFREVTAEHAQSGAAIEDKARASRSGEFEARRISAVAPGGLVHGGSRAAYSPEANLCGVSAQRIFTVRIVLRIISTRFVDAVVLRMGIAGTQAAWLSAVECERRRN